MSPERQRVFNYLAQFGLDGSEISEQFTDEGFFLVRHEITFHPWPNGLSVEWLRTLLLVTTRAEYRQAGIRSPV